LHPMHNSLMHNSLRDRNFTKRLDLWDIDKLRLDLWDLDKLPYLSWKHWLQPQEILHCLCRHHVRLDLRTADYLLHRLDLWDFCEASKPSGIQALRHPSLE
jgi:hypothetical protein